MSKKVQPSPISFSITYDGKSYPGHYTVSSRLLTASSLYGSKSTQLGGTPAHLLANMMLRELLDEAKARGEF